MNLHTPGGASRSHAPSTARAPLGVFPPSIPIPDCLGRGHDGARIAARCCWVVRKACTSAAGLCPPGGTRTDSRRRSGSAFVRTRHDRRRGYQLCCPPTSGCLHGRTVFGTIKPASSPTPNRELATVDGALTALAREHEKNLALRAQLQTLQAQQAACEADLRRCARRRPSEKSAALLMQSAPRCRRRTGKTPRPPCAQGSARRRAADAFARRRLLCFLCRSWKRPQPLPRVPIAQRRFPGWTRNGFSTRHSAICANLTG